METHQPPHDVRVDHKVGHRRGPKDAHPAHRVDHKVGHRRGPKDAHPAHRVDHKVGTGGARKTPIRPTGSTTKSAVSRPVPVPAGCRAVFRSLRNSALDAREQHQVHESAAVPSWPVVPITFRSFLTFRMFLKINENSRQIPLISIKRQIHGKITCDKILRTVFSKSQNFDAPTCGNVSDAQERARVATARRRKKFFIDFFVATKVRGTGFLLRHCPCKGEFG